LENNQNFHAAYKAELSHQDFKKLQETLLNLYGLKISEEKRILIKSRLQKRLRALNFSSFKDYLNYAFSKEGKVKEWPHLVEVITTHKTDFFREATHFDFLRDIILPNFTKESYAPEFRLWSAGCSTGEEVYTLAMVLQEFSSSKALNYHIWGTDVAEPSVLHAHQAVYERNRITPIPPRLQKKYLLKHKNPQISTIRIIPALRHKTSFSVVNLMDNYPFGDNFFDAIFCRNTLIYFGKETREMVIRKLLQKLKTGGFFFLGHSESILDMKLPLKTLKPTIFQKI